MESVNNRCSWACNFAQMVTPQVGKDGGSAIKQLGEEVWAGNVKYSEVSQQTKNAASALWGISGRSAVAVAIAASFFGQVALNTAGAKFVISAAGIGGLPAVTLAISALIAKAGLSSIMAVSAAKILTLAGVKALAPGLVMMSVAWAVSNAYRSDWLNWKGLSSFFNKQDSSPSIVAKENHIGLCENFKYGIVEIKNFNPINTVTNLYQLARDGATCAKTKIGEGCTWTKKTALATPSAIKSAPGRAYTYLTSFFKKPEETK